MVSGGIALERELGYTFQQPKLLQQALTHRSFGYPNNERLEFIGDGLLNCVIGRYLYENHPKASEGDLSRSRASLVNQQTLSEVAQTIQLGDHLLLGEGELKSGGFRRPSILADALEAIFGAIFTDANFDTAAATVLRLYTPWLADIDPSTHGKDPKTLLQEYLQAQRYPLPHYAVRRVTGEAHDQWFAVECRLNSLQIQTVGEGSSRRAAEQLAAQAALLAAQQTHPRKPGRKA